MDLQRAVVWGEFFGPWIKFLEGLRAAGEHVRRQCHWKLGSSWLGVRGVVLRADTAWATGLVVVGWVASLVVPSATTVGLMGWFPCLAGVVVLVFPAYCFKKVQEYLQATANYEDLRSGEPPDLLGSRSGPVTALLSRSAYVTDKSRRLTALILRFPFTAVVVFSLATGLAWSSNLTPIGLSLRHNLTEVAVAVPYVDQILGSFQGWLTDRPILGRIFPGESDERALLEVPWPWRMALKAIYISGIIALGSAWHGRVVERRRFAEGLVVEPERVDLPIDHEDQPQGKIVLRRAERIGPDCLGYLAHQLNNPDLAATTIDGRSADRCRSAVAALEVIFRARGAEAWQRQAAAASIVQAWLLDHAEALLRLDDLDPHANQHRLAESIRALATIIIEGRDPLATPADRPRPRANEDALAQLRQMLKESFLRSTKSSDRPYLLLASCRAAEILGTPAELKMLEDLTRKFSMLKEIDSYVTDRIFESRDRVLGRAEWRTAEIKRIMEDAKRLGLELEPSGDRSGATLRFRRPSDKSDGAVMVLIPAGSFIRGDDRGESTRPKRRVHVGAFLIDESPVSRESLDRWLAEHEAVIRLNRGFFETPAAPEGSDDGRPEARHVSWFTAMAYAAWAIPGGRLAREAEWEKAARGSLDDRRWPGDRPDDWPFLSPYGLTIGDGLEWAWDGHDPRAYERDHRLFNPRLEPGSDDSPRVVRGLVDPSRASKFTIADRVGLHPIAGGLDWPVGFRVVFPLHGD